MVFRCSRGYDYLCTRDDSIYPNILLLTEDDSDHTYEYEMGNLDESIIQELSSLLVKEDIPHRITKNRKIYAEHGWG